MKLPAAVLLVTLLAWPTMAFARPISAAPEVALDVRDSDALVDQLWTFPTAEIHPEGTAYFGTQAGLLWHVGVAPTDHVQFTLTPLVAKFELLGLDGAFKAVLYRGRAWRFAVVAGVATGSQPDQNVRLGPLAQYCFSATCSGSLHLGLIGGMGLEPEFEPPPDDVRAKAIYGSIGWQQTVVPHLRVVVDALESLSIDPGLPVISPMTFSVGGGAELSRSLVLTTGLRLHFESWAVGAAVLSFVDLDRGAADAFPWLNATFRLPLDSSRTPRRAGRSVAR